MDQYFKNPHSSGKHYINLIARCINLYLVYCDRDLLVNMTETYFFLLKIHVAFKLNVGR